MNTIMSEMENRTERINGGLNIAEEKISKTVIETIQNEHREKELSHCKEQSMGMQFSLLQVIRLKIYENQL